MKVLFAVATSAVFLLSVVPARAEIIYPISRCRVFDDTAFTQIPGQCGTVVRVYPRRLFVQTPRRPQWYWNRFRCSRQDFQEGNFAANYFIHLTQKLPDETFG